MLVQADLGEGTRKGGKELGGRENRSWWSGSSSEARNTVSEAPGQPINVAMNQARRGGEPSSRTSATTFSSGLIPPAMAKRDRQTTRRT